MRRSTSDTCTIWIARNGHLPITLLVKPKALLLLVAIALAPPIAWLGNRTYSLHRQNQELTVQNQVLSQAANDVFQQIEVLDAEIERLRERAGLPDDIPEDIVVPGQTSRSSVRPPQGGFSVKLGPVEAFEQAKGVLPELASILDQQVRPALNKTLAEEFAQVDSVPSIRPIKANIAISSKFGVRRNPFGWGYEVHNGIDFPGQPGTLVLATAPGTVLKAEWDSGYGYHVVIDHGYGYETLYGHLSKLQVTKGDQVKRSDTVGLMGNTGRSTGTHLHYSVYKNGKLVDPEEYLD